MNRGLYSAISAMRGSERAIQFSANNLANLSTPGFKQTRTVSEQFLALTDHGVDIARGTVGSIDFSQGPIDETGNPFELALEGDGFFAFESPSGEVLSRQGRLVVAEDGELVSPDGLPIAWEERRGPLDPFSTDFSVREDGVVSQDGRELGKLRLVDLQDRSTLVALSNGYYRAPLDAVEINATAVIHQGAVEKPNVSGIEQLVEMVAQQRSYDVASRSVSLISSSYERLNRPNA
ncbi:Flagellar basal-body rod protein FlgG [Planctomycetes bacterium Pla163]|uniref:Flagellar basal-body rod protein FlgG n=1 Tax=Rohdeia mirabilis TaxID=2528008 RepID=A0A518D517_9BACT|nr:Flagellar basal-body rod protein FlgG [Planctomycetes bacterium Pla163]